MVKNKDNQFKTLWNKAKDNKQNDGKDHALELYKLMTNTQPIRR
tara:strand:+ start:42 stop:173 length:132 start_codon:yes stop_codon:yes gene_type:complete